jgi:hypothetical protein
MATEQLCFIGEDEDIEGCTHTIEFDSQYLIIKSEKGNGEGLCTIKWDISPDFIQELEVLIAVIKFRMKEENYI